MAPNNTIFDAVVIGGGPAGLTAAIYLARFNRSVIVADHGSGRSTTHEINENYFGFPDGIASKELRERGRRQAERFGARFIDCKIEEVASDVGCFAARSGDGDELRGRTLIFATGVKDYLPEFENRDVQEYFGKSLFWCITCDGHKACDRRVTVVGATDDAATTALQFLNFTATVSLVTNRAPGGHEISDVKQRHLAERNIDLIEGEIARVHGGEGVMRAIELDGGRAVDVDFLFNQQGARPNSLLAQQIGVRTDDAGYISADIEQRTNVGRVYAAGDVTKAFAHQVATAAHEGATAGQAANYDLYEPWQRE